MDPENDSIYSLQVLKGKVGVQGETQIPPMGQDNFTNDLTHPSNIVLPNFLNL